jgi:DNA-binding GntR family transcriptional regulator
MSVGNQTAYKALAAEFREAILTGRLRPDEQLPPEVRLAEERGLSRQTVRQAIKELVSESLVYRVRGRGSFARPATDGAFLRSFGSVNDLLSLSEDTLHEVVKPLRVRTDPGAAARLQLPTDQVMTTALRRLHEDVVFCVSTVFLPLELGRSVAATGEFGSVGSRSASTVIGLLEQSADVYVAGAHQSVIAVAATPEVADLIECDPGTPVLQIDRLYYDRSGRMIELAITLFNSDRYSYRLDLRRSQR